MIHDFDIWAADRSEINSFSELENSTIAIEASFYLDRLLNHVPYKEPLLPALGGQPLAIKAYIENDLEALRNHHIKPIFVFDGLTVGKVNRPFRRSDEAVRLNVEAWDLYNQHLADKAVETFGNSKFAPPEDCYRLLQTILNASGIQFMVAPYSALGQIAYLAKRESEYVDAIAGPSDLLLYDVDKVITSIDFDQQEFTWVRRQTWMEDLGISSTDQFVDACMLSGCDLLEPLPILTNIHSNRKVQHLPQVLDLMKVPGKTGIAVCKQAQEDPAMKRADYLDRFRRRRLAIKNQVIMTSEGKIEPFDEESVPSDLHEVIGQRLPEELYYYLSKGAIGSAVLNQLTSQQIYETVSTDGGDSEDYRILVRDKLTPIRSKTLALLSHSLSRAYQHHNVKLQCWFEPSRETEIHLGDIPSPAPPLRKWCVQESVFAKFLDPDENGKLSISSAVRAIKDEGFAAASLAKSTAEPPRIKTSSEIVANTMWRFLHLREYINDEHTLTNWGLVLDATLPAQGASTPALDEALLIAVELLRLDLLNSRELSVTYGGAPMHGSETDKSNCLLVSRIACLGKLNHKPIGYTGPLSRNLLAYNSTINAVRRALRDLEEMTLATMLMNGDATREDVNFSDIGLGLPFLLTSDCGLGIAMKHYLDDLAMLAASKLSVTKEDVKAKSPKEWFPHAIDLSGDLEKAFAMWDAVYKGVMKACEVGLMTASDKTAWEEIDKWVAERR